MDSHSWSQSRPLSKRHGHASFQYIKSQGWHVFGWNLQSSHVYGGVVSGPVEGAQYDERRLLVLRNAAGA